MINEVHGWRRAALWCVATLLRVWVRTLRFEADPTTLDRLTKSDVPAAIVLWHNRLFLSAEIFRRYRTQRRVYGLVSASKDGAWLAAFYRMIGIHPVRGSSNTLGREAAKLLIERLREGHDIGITPDGPRGPLYVVEPGVLVVTRRNQAPMILLGAEFTRARQLKSWDRFYVPLPFSRVIMRCTILPPVNSNGEKISAADVRAALMAINPDL
ncbi:MAG: lysophospholipid acyltransferase family protein [Candidatus Didemnitutus sp.]|nr:lysophospholipid acyltransferase family protein [Candidatus Didemnitutus sp.]